MKNLKTERESNMYNCNCDNNIGAGSITSTDNDQYLRIEWCDNVTDVPTKGTFLNKIQGLTDSESDISTKLDAEIERAKTAEQNIQADLDNEILERRSDDEKLQSQINVLNEKQSHQQDQVITRTLTENTVTETFDAPNGEQILILQDENKTGSIKFDKTTDTVILTGTNVKVENVVTPVNDKDVTNKSYVDNADTVNANAIAQNEENITNEITERKAEDSKLQEQITENRVDIKNNKDNIDAEINVRNEEDEKLQQQITTEISDRKSADEELQQQISNITAVQIRNKSEVINSTEANVQTIATNYIKTNYDRDPQNFDGLIITITDKNNDKILYIYSEVSKIWINSGINDVDLSNYYQKSEIDTKIDTINQSITEEIQARTTADSTLQTNIDNEVSRAKAAEAANETLINKEIDERKAALENKQDKFATVDMNAANTTLQLINSSNKIYLKDKAADEVFIENAATKMQKGTLSGKAIPNVDYVDDALSNKQDKFATYTVTEGHGILAPDADVLSIEGKTVTLSGNGDGIHSQVTVAPNSTQINGQTVSINSTDGTHISNVVEPVEDTDAVNKEYIDNSIQDINLVNTLQDETAKLDSTELISSQSGTWITEGWTGDSATGFTHTSGNTNSLKYPITGNSDAGLMFSISFDSTVKPTTDNIKVSIGNSDLFNLYGQSENPLNVGVKSKGSTDGTIYLEFIPSSTFTGTISNILVYKILAPYEGKYKITGANGKNAFEVRASSVGGFYPHLNNVFIGSDSGSYNTTGMENVSLGTSALSKNTSGFWNTAIGYRALQNTNAGSRNIGIGYMAGAKLEVGQRNIAIGTHSLRENVKGNFNIAIGADSQLNSTSGEGNIGIGTGTLYYNNGVENIAIGKQAISASVTSGQNNIAIGAFSLNSVQGDSNIAIGRNAGYSITTGIYNVIVGAGSGRNGNKNTIIGCNSGGQLTENSLENTVIGYYSGTKLADNKHCILIGNRIAGEATGDYQLNIGNIIKGTTASASNPYVEIEGRLVLTKSPTADNEATTKKYVDDTVGDINTILATLVDVTTTQSDEPVSDEEIINEEPISEEPTI